MVVAALSEQPLLPRPKQMRAVVPGLKEGGGALKVAIPGLAGRTGRGNYTRGKACLSLDDGWLSRQGSSCVLRHVGGGGGREEELSRVCKGAGESMRVVWCGEGGICRRRHVQVFMDPHGEPRHCQQGGGRFVQVWMGPRATQYVVHHRQQLLRRHLPRLLLLWLVVVLLLLHVSMCVCGALCMCGRGEAENNFKSSSAMRANVVGVRHLKIHQPRPTPTPTTHPQGQKATMARHVLLLLLLVVAAATVQAFSPTPPSAHSHNQQRPPPPPASSSSSSSAAALDGVGRAGALLGQMGGALAVLGVLGVPLSPAGG